MFLLLIRFFVNEKNVGLSEEELRRLALDHDDDDDQGSILKYKIKVFKNCN